MTQAKVRFKNADRSRFFPEVKKRVDDYFKERGITPHGNAFMAFKVAFYVVGVFGSLAALLFVPMSWPLQLVFWSTAGAFAAFCGLNICHDAIHGSLSKSKRVNRVFAQLFNVLGANAYIWEQMHNVVHHSFTNIHGHDEDLESVPFLRFSPHQERKPIHRIQHWIALPVYALASLSWVTVKDFKKFSQTKIGPKGNQDIPKKEWAILIVTKLIYHGLFLVTPLLIMQAAWWQIVIGFVLMHFIEGMILAVVFMLAHVVEETHQPMPDDEGSIQMSWAAHQMYTTANFATRNPLVSFFCGGLNFQIEHHLFPLVSHVHLPAISKIVEQTAHEHGLPYYTHNRMGAALASHLRLLRDLGRMDNPLAHQSTAHTHPNNQAAQPALERVGV